MVEARASAQATADHVMRPTLASGIENAGIFNRLG